MRGVGVIFLKSLEMQGFKSFPDRMRVDFHQGLTAIVGPNGSGKSNIADAIRWVLGEQSTKALRGAKMEDVIFAGTAERRKMGFAEVALTLDNTDGSLKTDYSEVTVTRRFYRSGESEYYINQKAVRLRDVHELFMDTGIGRDGYSVIGQGRIDEILSVRPDERREIFDEAAGITKYRWRREEAQKKLEAAAENLTRVEGLAAEMENQLEPLGKQAEKERTYNALREELKSVEVGYWLEKLVGADTDAAKAEEDLTTAQQELEALQKTVGDLAEQVGRLTETMHALEGEREQLRTEAQETAAKAAACGSTAALKKAAAENSRQNRERFERQSADYRKRLETVTEQLTEADRALAERNQTLENAEESLQKAAAYAVKTAGNVEEAEKARELVRLQEKSFLENESRERERLSSAAALAKALAEQLHSFDLNDREREEARADALARLAERDSVCENARKLVQSRENVLAGCERLRQSRETREREANEAHTAQRIRQGDIENRLRLLRELERDYEGYAKAVRAVMAQKNALGGIRGPVSGLLQAEDSVVAAIETALGAAGGNIVVDTEEDAKRAIGMLKSRDEGRATFLPLSVVRGTELQPREYENLPGVVGLASRLVQFDADYSPVMRNLLGRVIVIDHIDHAILAARQSGHRYKLVTLDGQVLSPGGAMTGGSLARSSGVLSRANELKRLTEARRDCAAILEKTAADADNARRELATLRIQREAAQTALDSAREQLNTAMRARELEAAGLEALSQNRQEERAAITARLETAQKAVTEAEGALERSREALADNKRLEAEKTDILNQALTQSKTAQESVETARTACEAARREAAGLNARMQALEAQVQSAREDALRHERERQDFRQDAAALEREAAEAQQQQTALLQEAQKLEDRLQALLSRRERLEADRVEAERRQTEEGRRQIALEREQVRLENHLENARHAQDNLTASLWEEYGLTRTTAREFTETLPKRTEPAEAGQVKKQCEDLRRRLKALGSVYTGAIEEYAKLRERYDFCMTQKNDAEESRKKLTTVISELSAQMRQQFAEQFKILARTFGKTFTEIFGGGKASLELEDPTAVLESGIDIKVQLPGKTMKALSLLSGGERAFVAIALYFAILQVRPTPFCILDEIDAALDDVNVGRFARYMRGYLEQTQFIVITHRRNTMEEADMLYGVAMPVQGVSKLLPFDVSDAARKLGL